MKMSFSVSELNSLKEFLEVYLKSVPFPVGAKDLEILKCESIEDVTSFCNDLFKDNLSLKVSFIKKELVVEIKEEFVNKFFKIYSRFLSLAIPQVIALYKSIIVFSEDIVELQDEYTNINLTETDKTE